MRNCASSGSYLTQQQAEQSSCVVSRHAARSSAKDALPSQTPQPENAATQLEIQTPDVKPQVDTADTTVNIVETSSIIESAVDAAPAVDSAPSDPIADEAQTPVLQSKKDEPPAIDVSQSWAVWTKATPYEQREADLERFLRSHFPKAETLAIQHRGQHGTVLVNFALPNPEESLVFSGIQTLFPFLTPRARAFMMQASDNTFVMTAVWDNDWTNGINCDIPMKMCVFGTSETNGMLEVYRFRRNQLHCGWWTAVRKWEVYDRYPLTSR